MERRELFLAAPLAMLSTTAAVQTDGDVLGQIAGSTALVGVRGVSVPTVRKTEVRSLVDGGILPADGYTSLVMNLAGQMRGADDAGGIVGAMLIPDVAPFDRAYANMGLLPESLEISLNVSSSVSPYFMAKQKRADVGFPRYRVLFFNESNSPVTVSFFVYRTTSR